MVCDGKETKRDCYLDTAAMCDFADKLFDLSWMEHIEDDLRRMNDGKVGHPFIFTDALVSWVVTLRCAFNISYRLVLGTLNHFLKKHGFPTMSLTQLHSRCIEYSMPELNCRADVDTRILAFGRCDVGVSDTPIEVAVDSTGFSLNKYGGWLCHRWNKRPVSGWVKLHVAADSATNIVLAYAISDESCGDSTCLDVLMDEVLEAGHKVSKLLADAAYDSKNAWNRYSRMGIEVAINIRSSQLGKYETKGKKSKSHGSVSRGIQIQRIKEVGRDQWKIDIGYGRRWKVECTFSDLKRLFGDILRARARMNDLAETFQKVKVLNIYKTGRAKIAEAR